MKKIILSLLVVLTATMGATAQIAVNGTGNERTFDMPAYDVEVTTELWYKLSETATDNEANYGTKNDVFLERILQPNGWNSFCAPFAISDPADVFGEGVKVKAFTGSSFSGNTLTLNFTSASTIAAGTPYLIKLPGASNVDLTADGKEFEGVTQNWTANTVTPTGSEVSFVPVLVPTNMTANDKTKLFVTEGNKLTYPAADGNIYAFRAYFQLSQVMEARAFAMDFGDEEVTGIIGLSADERSTDGAIYTLDGRRVNGKPTQKGIYIQNGKKVIIK